MSKEEKVTLKPRNDCVYLRTEIEESLIEVPENMKKNPEKTRVFVVAVGGNIKDLKPGDELVVAPDSRVKEYKIPGGSFILAPQEAVLGVVHRE